MQKIFLDESGETIYRPSKDIKIFGLGGLVVDDDNELQSLFDKLVPYLHDGELKYDYYKDHIEDYNSIIQIINSSNINYHIEIVEPYYYYLLLLMDYLLFPYWLYSDEKLNTIRHDFFYDIQESLFKLNFEEVKKFFLINSIEDYIFHGTNIINNLKENNVTEMEMIFNDMISDFEITKEKIQNHELTINNIKPIPDVIGNKKKNNDIFFLYHIQCLYSFLEKYKDSQFIHDENQRLHNYILQIVNEKYPTTDFKFSDSKLEKGLIIIDSLVSYYTHAIIDLDHNKNRGLLFNPKSYNLILNNNLLAKIKYFELLSSL